jgi:hypothetical protein
VSDWSQNGRDDEEMNPNMDIDANKGINQDFDLEGG